MHLLSLGVEIRQLFRVQQQLRVMTWDKFRRMDLHRCRKLWALAIQLQFVFEVHLYRKQLNLVVLAQF